MSHRVTRASRRELSVDMVMTWCYLRIVTDRQLHQTREHTIMSKTAANVSATSARELWRAYSRVRRSFRGSRESVARVLALCDVRIPSPGMLARFETCAYRERIYFRAECFRLLAIAADHRAPGSGSCLKVAEARALRLHRSGAWATLPR